MKKSRLALIGAGSCIALGVLTVSKTENPIACVVETECSGTDTIVRSQINSEISTESKQYQLSPDLKQLNLTIHQQDELEAIDAEIMVEMAEILTPAQMDDFQKRQADGHDIQQAIISVGLSPAQRKNALRISQDAQERKLVMLTPDQRSQFSGS